MKFANMTDEEIRSEIKKDPFNGLYATYICKQCGAFFIDPDGNTNTAKIIDNCSKCVMNNK